jgi:prepilin-type N-terminal cleavage/methylation domain-containing protein
MKLFSFTTRRNSSQKGFTLIEVIVGVTIFSAIATSSWIGLSRIFQANQILRARTTAANLATEQIEIIRNLPYDDVGVPNAIPNGVIPREQNLTRDNYEFLVTTTIRNIDQPFDGTIGGTPNDTSPADNKLVEIEIACDSCPGNFRAVTYSTWVAPLSLESVGDNGALFINVFDANGQVLSGIDVHIENNQTSTPIIIDDVTNNNGILQIIDAYPGTGAYEITVSKDGYSSEQTYEIGGGTNPVPDKPHANVVSGQVTEISFAIDELATVNISAKNNICATQGSVDLNIRGEKTIGVNAYKYENNVTTSGSGTVTLDDVEWDTYTTTITETGLDLIGANPNVPFAVNPGGTQDVDLIVGASDPNAVLITVLDGSNDQLLSNAFITLDRPGLLLTATTGSGYLEQKDWSSGAGQEAFTDETRYLSDNGDIDTINPVGTLKLEELSGTYDAAGFLLSSTFDVGTTTNFLALEWLPNDQPAEVGSEPVQFQIASNETLDEPLSWSYKGPDGTGSTYYTIPGTAIHDTHDGDRYFRYRVFLETDDTAFTPNISRVWITFANDCTPVGQAYFGGLSNATYDVTISRDGYDTEIIEDVSFPEAWQTMVVTLNPS